MGATPADIKRTSEKLVETLASFGVRTKIINTSCGPSVTRYELQPESGVKVKAIANLADDIALHLAATSIRMECPIPGLTRENFGFICRIMLDDLKSVLAEKNVAFTYDDAAVALLVEKGYSEKYGARNLRRLIQTDVEDAVAAVIIESYQNAVTSVSLTAENGALKLESR